MAEQETVADVLAEMRGLALNIAAADINGFGNQVAELADEIEAAHARELEALRARVVELDVDSAEYICAHLGAMFPGDTLDHDDAATIERARKMLRAAIAAQETGRDG